MTSNSGDEDAYSLTAGDLRFSLRWQGDRFQQWMVAPGAPPWIGGEKAGNDPWPESCVLQEVHIHDAGDQRLLMAVGKAGGTHWSAVFRQAWLSEANRVSLGSSPFNSHAPKESEPIFPVLLCEFAVRLKTPPQRLQVVYRQEPGAQQTTDLYRGASSEHGTWRQPQITLLPLGCEALVFPGTVAWSYGVWKPPQSGQFVWRALSNCRLLASDVTSDS